MENIDEQWPDRSIEAMETSWKNSSMEDMELDESGHLSPRCKQTLYLQHEKSNHDYNSFSLDQPNISFSGTNPSNDGWKHLYQTLNTVSTFKSTNSSLKNDDKTTSQHNLSLTDIPKHQHSTSLKLKTQVDKVKNMRSLCQPLQKKQKTDKICPTLPKLRNSDSKMTTKAKAKKTRCCSVSILFLLISMIIVLSSVFIHFCFHTDCSEFKEFDEINLRNKLKDSLFGQELAVTMIPVIMNEYLAKLKEKGSAKPLVVSIHGWTGVGKNFMSRILSRYFISKTKFTKFLVPLHFPHESKQDLYFQQIVEWTNSNITECEFNFFLFDEMDKASKGVLSGLQMAIINQSNNSNSNTPVIFLLLSNSKGSDINRIVFTSEKTRSELTIDQDFKHVFDQNDAWFSSFNANNIIDHFVPFLPLEKHHIKQCIKQDSKTKNLQINDVKMNQILSEMTFVTVPGTNKQYSKTGCKRVSDKVDLVMYMYD